MNNIPAPPPGFTLQSNVPPPPPGFTLDAQQPDPAARYAQLHAALSAMPPEQRAAAVAGLSQQDQQVLQQGQQAVAQQAMDPQARAQDFQNIQAQNVASQSPLLTATQGFGKSFVDTGRGIGELVGAESPQDVAQSRVNDQALMNSGAGQFGDYAGQFAQMVGLGGVGGTAARGLSLAGRAVPYFTSALTSGAFLGAQPVTQDESRGKNAAIGVGLGLAGEAIPGVLGAAAKATKPSLSAAKQAAIQTAEKYGIPLHLSQVTDSKALQTLGSATKYLPFSGNAAAQDAQRTAFNRALSSTIGQSSSDLSPEVMASAKAANSAGYNALFDRNAVQLAPKTWARLGSIVQQAKQDLPPDQARVVINQVQKYVNAAGANNGAIPGRLYQNIRQTVQKVEGQNQPSKYLVGQVRKAMQDAAGDSFGPEDSQALQALNQQFSNLKILNKALGQAQGANYSVSPANLWRLANGKYGSSPQMRELAQLGQTVLKDQIPDSGTAARNVVYHGLTTGAPGVVTLPPLALAGATVGRALNSPLAAAYLPGAGSNMLMGLSLLTKPANRLLPLLATQPNYLTTPQ